MEGLGALGAKAVWLMLASPPVPHVSPFAVPGAGAQAPASAHNRVEAQADTEDAGPDVDVLVGRLASATDEELQAVLVEAFGVFLEDAREMRLERAERLALAMHGRARAQWSALSLGLLSTRTGEHERADRVLREQYARAQSPAERVELLERRAIAALGAGERERGLDLLGRATVLGGSDGRQMLARDALARRDYGLAARLFGSLLPPVSAGRAPYEAGEVAPWALRGWGVSLLGESADPTERARPSDAR